ncbi:MarR family winged helix-turn-helix transcriptional regulator [Leuconostoc gelidum]|uniref:MarR family transcriptional regulator n=1 Tax=Leuconostoc gelidum subsp. gelidum TaxID=1607839 RepID=A0AB35FZ42_LEUGE|nr:MarR family transcriptional regulator [Leuconostoc gelidum]AFS39594.1 zinc transport transcriptional regulator [Leuconostoc gelidum JB7]MBZ5964947.1 MarR family transcriptional regulator [Leuconostoc gelidum subsp. gelidum]MBZ5974488.1 MarR family transcriptional regulator [Leuconostoc gelidum subsp. gelidum]MBZ5977326.1 MarR family transcriptional regulator [Leuconostoc gelidum subsp. gelidum]MBZ5991674.1 MarR family transcriptional regulator [Leuconostoc gelidum subsp. gelidum]
MSESDNIIQELNTFVHTYAANSEFIRTTTVQQINATQAHLLMLLHSQSATNTVLADTMKLTKPAITKAIKNLITHGYVISTKDATDKRSVHYTLTPKGVKLAWQHEQSHQNLHHDISATVSNFTPEQQATIMTFLEQINHLKDNHS